MNWIYDKRIDAYNCSFEMTIEDYYDLVKDCLNDNEYQRRRVRNSGSIYNLLKQDLKKGCIMPPLVLALPISIEQCDNPIKLLKEHRNELKIIDGLQRSYTIKELITDYSNSLYEDNNYLKNLVRVELYSGINKLGILYKMLTLNTGQTPMSTRHQIEIIYSEYKRNCNIPGVRLITESEGEIPTMLGEYKFRDVIEGFTSFLQKDYLTLDRKDILENVRDLERISKVETSQYLFYDFVDTYHHFVYKVHSLFNLEFENESIIKKTNISGSPYACSVISLFNKSQSLTGYGCAIAEIIDKNLIGDVKDLHRHIEDICFSDFDRIFIELMKKLDYVRRNAKKIGNDQRKFFYYFFLHFFSIGNFSFLNFEDSINKAFDYTTQRNYEDSLF